LPRQATVGVPVHLRVGLTVRPKRPSAKGLTFQQVVPGRPFDVEVFLLFSEDDFELTGDFCRRLVGHLT
jgi:hypothetical protein